MPTYVVTAPQGRLSAAQKQRIAADVTRVHCSVTGAPAYFAQVLFNDVPEGNYFVGGRLLQGSEHVFLHGQIRAGRDEPTKERLLLELMAAVAEGASLPVDAVQVYLVDVPARQIAEYGRLLPRPGEEAAWWDAIPPALKARMEALGG
ncbi:4-oxalocrotonate tautomerase family protein [Piscinibacter sakaiensis]|uniref:4-oxalocrotonate tautomerase-like protein n=1 Tax=Piscinibacter sakaiensis TaxID=1547922 RepID=A0A0K8P1G1_PISS1|nr:4-oxalocrotonate tautomerase family protein [Piscinibacter sakaiensis]GAP36502.1 4-oxalocrotonate tautomerase-like protein [Piscinibacter sakaiensis]